MTDYEEFKKSKQLLFAKKVVQSPQCVTIGPFFSYDLREASLSRNMNHNIQIDTQVKFLKYEEKLLTWMHEFIDRLDDYSVSLRHINQ